VDVLGVQRRDVTLEVGDGQRHSSKPVHAGPGQLPSGHDHIDDPIRLRTERSVEVELLR
jgi:hypothetical protein